MPEIKFLTRKVLTGHWSHSQASLRVFIARQNAAQPQILQALPKAITDPTWCGRIALSAPIGIPWDHCLRLSFQFDFDSVRNQIRVVSWETWKDGWTDKVIRLFRKALFRKLRNSALRKLQQHGTKLHERQSKQLPHSKVGQIVGTGIRTSQYSPEAAYKSDLRWEVREIPLKHASRGFCKAVVSPISQLSTYLSLLLTEH